MQLCTPVLCFAYFSIIPQAPSMTNDILMYVAHTKFKRTGECTELKQTNKQTTENNNSESRGKNLSTRQRVAVKQPEDEEE